MFHRIKSEQKPAESERSGAAGTMSDQSGPVATPEESTPAAGHKIAAAAKSESGAVPSAAVSAGSAEVSKPKTDKTASAAPAGDTPAGRVLMPAKSAPENTVSSRYKDMRTSSSTPKKDSKMTEQKQTQTKADQTEKLYAGAVSESPATPPASPYVRSPLRGSGYAAGVSPYKAPASVAAPEAKGTAMDQDRRLTIGSGITMSGEIESCDYLLVEGTVEAALKGARVLDIAESGVFYGTVEIQEASIAGRFEGDITVHGRLTLAASAVITGSVTYRELEVEAGAVIDGRLTPSAQVPAAPAMPAAPGQEVTPAAMKPSEAETPPAVANTGGELFPAGNVTAAE